MRARHALLFFLLGLSAYAAHFFLFRHVLALLTTEHAGFLLFADSLRAGRWSVYAFQQDYVGITENVLRALWCAIWLKLDGSDAAYFASHAAFTYWVIPMLMALGTFVALRSFFTFRASAIVAWVMAVGLNFWVTLYAHSFYPITYALTCALIALRGKAGNPFLDLPRSRLFAFFLVAGHLLYLSRASALWICAALVPLDWFLAEAKTILGNVKRASLPERIAALSCRVFLLLYVFLKLTGRNLGTWNGKAIKLDADPNLMIAALIFMLLLARRTLGGLRDRVLRARGAIAASAFALGFLPEIGYRLSRLRLSTATLTTGSYDLAETLEVISELPARLLQFFAGFETGTFPTQTAALFYTKPGFTAIFPLLLLGVATVVFANRCRQEKDLRFAAVGAVLVVVVFTQLKTHVVPHAPARYLAGLLPAYALALGALVDGAWQPRMARALLALALLAHTGHHLAARARLAGQLAGSGFAAGVENAANDFRRESVPVVLTDDFMNTHQYTYASRGQPYFWSTQRPWGPPEAYKLAMEKARVGLMLKTPPLEPRYCADLWEFTSIERLQIRRAPRCFALRSLALINGMALFIGTSLGTSEGTPGGSKDPGTTTN